ncbi:tetratricopeptide repeat protein [Streptomyces goshikiensis]|uniref:Tetratricopeptide repeat protein n=1 Tax=Streptomyces goshikiensis TaxID=1942 RepID=A0ABZ1RR11_9ACTN|nr:caspase family protein [Streptomyces goshikiensis]
MSETETPEEIRGAALGVVVENYQSGRFRQLTGATAQMRELCELLEERGYGTTVVEDPEWNDVNKPLGDWARKWRATGGHGPAVVLWSGHGVLDDRELRLIVRDTVDPEFDGEVHSANLLASTASLSGADQVLLLIDTCHAGAGVVPSLEKALDRLSQRNLPPGRWAWFGVIASCRPQEKAEAGGVLLDAFARVLREGPRTDEYRHEWSRRNGQVSGNTVIQAVLAEWPSEVGHRPLNAMTGRDRLMFANPLRAAATEPELVEHLVQAARGAAPDDEGWFFSGRRRVLGEITEWLEARRPGLFLVTGSAGSGKSAVLGRIATLSDPAHRADVLAHQPLTPRDPDPGEDSVDVALHLRGFTVQQLAEAIARRLSLHRPQTPAALIAEVEKGWPESRRRLVLVLDGLDEAAPDQAHPVVEQLLAPLSRLSCVLLGSRDRPFRPQQEPGESLDRAVSRILGIRARAADLDDESDTERDIQEYCRRRLLARTLPMADATTAAEFVAHQASPSSGGFLFARMATDSVIRRLSTTGAEGWDWAEAIPSSISAAFTEDLRDGPKRERDGGVLPHAAEHLLTALAWSARNGMPARGVWEATASALGQEDGFEYGPEDVDWLLNEYGRYVVEDSDGTQAVYRLYHREFVAHLRHASGHSDGAYRVARAVVDLLRGQTSDATVSENANPYLRASLAAHAVMAGERGTSMVRELTYAQEEVFRPDLAEVLGDVAVSLSRAGRREAALAPAQEAADLYRALARDNPAAYLPELAGSLNNLANAQSATGDGQAALTTITEAVTIRRNLAKTNPAAHLPDLAGSLNNLATCQSATGDRPGALTTITEAVTIRRDLAKTNPAAYLPNLATSLNNLATCQSDNGDRPGALTTITEATELYRTLARINPAAHLPNLASSLNNLATIQSETGDRPGALTTITEATDLYRTLARINPAAHLANLASSLNNLANVQFETGDGRGALTTITKAVTIRRNLAKTNPAAHLANLASSLNNLANAQSLVGDRPGALATITEATDLYRTLARTSPAVHLPSLATSLNNLATCQSETGDRPGALTTITEATELYRTLARTSPAAYLPNLAGSLNNLAACQSDNGDRPGALTTITEATDLYRTLARTSPAAYLPDLAMSLNNLATFQSETGDGRGALSTITEATDLYRTLARTSPAAYLPDLAGSLNNLATCQSATGDRPGALTTITEAVTIRRDLAKTNPAAHLANLAGSLNNLSACQSETGDRPGALTTITEAVTIRRDLAKTNPAAHLPDLADSLHNLSACQSETGDRPGALTTITEAVTIRRDLAKTNPAAHLPNLVSSLNALAHMAPARQTLDAYSDTERSLSDHTQAAGYIAVQRATFQLTHVGTDVGIRALIPLARASQPQPSETADVVAFRARQVLRAHAAQEGPNQVVALWREETGIAPPAWLALPETALDLAVEWINCPTWTASRAFWDAHSHDLRSADTALALEEIALVTAAAAEHLQIVRTAAAEGPDDAFRPYLTGELLHTWTDLPTWQESLTYLTDHEAVLLHDQALELLGAGLETADTALHFALIALARADGIPAAYGYADDRSTLHTRLQQLLASPEPQPNLLQALALLELFVYQEQFTAAAHLALAAALTGAPPAPDTVWPPAEPADRDRVISEVADLIGRQPQQAPALSALIRSILAASAAA